ncbi:MAG: HDOD domain-containing protein [Chitinispirillaceae bacterium]|nr:HDOD domain-containing protein [Chitinispirillaceae bacterium]
MINLVLLSQNVKEQQILNLALTQQGLKVLLSEPSYQNFVFIMQYMPDIVLVELPHLCIEQLNFTSRIRAYKRTRLLPIIGYGNKIDPSLRRGMLNSGITIYLERPLKYSELLALIQRLLKPFNKTIETKPPVSEKEKDLALILSPDALPMQKVEAMSKHIYRLLAFPFTIAKVLQITNNEKTGASHLAQAISSDPSISAHMLKIANSVFFASSNRRISSIKEAVIRIGFEETKKITMGMSVINLFSSSNKNLGFDRTDFWYHSLTVALIAERLAKMMGDISTEEAFLAGLLHDLGILLLDEYFPTVFNEVLEQATKSAGRFYDVEKTRLNVTHLDLIGELFPRWKIPQQITDAIVGHYIAAGFDHPPEPVNEKLSVCVTLGNLFAKLIHSGRECDEYVTPVDNILMTTVKLPHGLPRTFINNIMMQVMSTRAFFGLEEREYGGDCPDNIDPKSIRIGVVNPEAAVIVPPSINLENHGMQCEIITSGSVGRIPDEKYHAIVWWSQKPVNPETIAPLTRLRPAALGTNATPGTLPILLFCPDSARPERFPGCSVFNNAFDLRVLESGLAAILSASTIPESLQGAA